MHPNHKHLNSVIQNIINGNRTEAEKNFNVYLKEKLRGVSKKDKVAGKTRKNGLSVMSLDQFVEDTITEAPIGLGAQTTPFPEDEMQAYLDRIKTKTKSKRDKFNKPYIHGSNIEIKDGSGKSYDTNSLRKAITTRPARILKQNEKMQHSNDGQAAEFYNIGLPALKGLAVDEDTGDFVIVNTCPGAGECKLYCYAMKGGYIQFPGSSMFQSKILNFLLNDPTGFEQALSSEIQSVYDAKSDDKKIVIRWHDDGDFFSPQYVNMAIRVAKRFPEVDFYAYTKVADAFKSKVPSNFKMNFSKGAINREEKQIDFTKDKHSVVVPKAMFNDLVAKDGRKLIKDEKGRTQFTDAAALDEFKKRLASTYKINPKSILTYDQMMARDLGDVPKWNIIVMPGDGDNSANDPGVKGTYLLFH